MPLSQEAKDEILAHYGSGMDPKAIAAVIKEKYGAAPIAVHGLINQIKWNSGEVPRPANTGRPKKVRETTTKTYEEDESAPAQAQTSGVALPAASPLFAGGPGILDRVEVHRIHAMPRSAGLGIVGEIDPEASSADLQSIFGGGRYYLKGFDARGQMIRTRSVTIAGRSIPVDGLEMDGGLAPNPYDGGPMRSVEDILAIERQRADERELRDRRDREEREAREKRDREDRERRERQDREDRERFYAQQLQQQERSFAQQLAMVTAMQNKNQGGLSEIVGVVKTIKDMTDDGSESGDFMSEAVKAAPKMLESIKGIAMAQQPHAVPGNPGQPVAQVTQEQAAQVIQNTLVQAGGLTPDEAQAELAYIGEYLQTKAVAKQQGKYALPKGAARRAVPAAAPAAPPAPKQPAHPNEMQVPPPGPDGQPQKTAPQNGTKPAAPVVQQAQVPSPDAVA